MQPEQQDQINCKFYIVRINDTLFGISRRFGVSVNAILSANPQITDPNRIFLGQRICIPIGQPEPECKLRVLSLSLLSEQGQSLPVENGAVRLNANVIVRATFNLPVSQAYFFIVPTGTETCEFARLIGVDCPSAVTGVAETDWMVPSGTLGRVFVVACLDSCCARSEEVLVFRN